MKQLLDHIFLGDCLDIMPSIPDKCIDAVICDLPYGVLNKTNENAKWDSVIPFQQLWRQYERIIKDNGVIILFGQGMFTAKLMLSNPKLWRYNLVWKKGERTSGFLNAKRMPLRNHEDICVFYKQQPTYNPQMTYGQKLHSRGKGKHKFTQRCYGSFKEPEDGELTNLKYPKSVVNFERDYNIFLHPTQKPVNLIRWLILSYTNPGDLVLDNCMGSGTTCVAAIKENRRYIGIEKEEKYFQIAEQRIETELKQPRIFDNI